MLAIRLRDAVLLVISTLLMLGTHETWGADIANVPNGEHCAIRLEGELTAGDSDHFAEAIRSFQISDSEKSEGISSDRALCLNSPGGNYLEGRKIAQIVHDQGLTTRVEAAGECYSSCALIFMAGRVHGAESDTVSRYLHVEGKLGFHAPYFDLAKDETMTGEQAGNLVRVSSAIIAEFISFSSSRTQFDIQPMMSSSLLAEMLATGPDQVSVVDTVEKAARWNINLDGIRKNKQIDRRDAVRACLNFQSWFADESSKTDSLSYYLSGQEEIVTTQVEGESQSFRKIQTGGMEDQHCLVSRKKESVAMIGLCSSNDFNGMRIGDCTKGILYYVPWYYSLDPNTPLIALE